MAYKWWLVMTNHKLNNPTSGNKQTQILSFRDQDSFDIHYTYLISKNLL